MDRIVVAFAGEKARSRVTRLLESGGLSPAGSCSSGAEVIRLVWNLGDAIVICGYKLRDMTAGDLAGDLLGIGTLLVVSSAGNLEFCHGENLFKLPIPASRADFFDTLQLLRQADLRRFRRGSREASPADDGQTVRRAKERLIHVNHMTEAEAHRFLQRRSMNSGIPLTEAARSILEPYA